MAITEDKLIVFQPRKERPRKGKRADLKSQSGRAGCRHRAPNTGPAPFTSSRYVGGPQVGGGLPSLHRYSFYRDCAGGGESEQGLTRGATRYFWKTWVSDLML